MTNLVNIVEFSRVKRLWQRCELTPGRRNVCRKIRVNNYKSQREIPVEEIPCHFLCLSKQPLRFVARMLLRSETLKWFWGSLGLCVREHIWWCSCTLQVWLCWHWMVLRLSWVERVQGKYLTCYTLILGPVFGILCTVFVLVPVSGPFFSNPSLEFCMSKVFQVP